MFIRSRARPKECEASLRISHLIASIWLPLFRTQYPKRFLIVTRAASKGSPIDGATPTTFLMMLVAPSTSCVSVHQRLNNDAINVWRDGSRVPSFAVCCNSGKNIAINFNVVRSSSTSLVDCHVEQAKQPSNAHSRIKILRGDTPSQTVCQTPHALPQPHLGVRTLNSRLANVALNGHSS